jgi:hypothetical protein
VNGIAVGAIVVGSILAYGAVTGFLWRRYYNVRHAWVQRIHDSRKGHYDRKKAEDCLDCQMAWIPLSTLGVILWPLTVIGFLPVFAFLTAVRLGDKAATPKRTRADLEARIAELEHEAGIS